MARAELKEAQRNDRLGAQLALASTKLEIRTNAVLTRLVASARQRLQRDGDAAGTAQQLAVDLGYYLFCNDYQMPRAAYDLLAVACEVNLSTTENTRVIRLPKARE